MILAEVTYVPIGLGTSASRYINAALEEFKRYGIKFYPNSMGTVLEAGTLDEIFEAVKRGERAILSMGIKRVETYVKIDDRIDVENTAERKIKALKY
ncbi:MTH1187 family thiamine-binding protein [Thermoplasma sp.]|uniref:MTH1187 family thiamine-binding protein n=1 Tax=Thermoplasma sp. TaxID=1973142 RepID=UPI001289477B|nr:MTH1187 family thiamine-binding protein [Thermoplasma sp.]KAA8923093.1 MAG: MTH1187 family thiamine-binding protein [Thermoplasma sp.]